jgi:hypothetical protein
MKNIENYKEVWKKLDAFSMDRGFFNEGMVFKNPDSKLSWNVSASKTTSSQLKMRIEDHK